LERLLSRLRTGSYSLRSHILVLGFIVVLPVTLVTGVLLVRSASLERSKLDNRMMQVASALADDIDREIEQDFILLRTLSTFPSYVDQDWPNFYAQAKAALQGRAYVIVLDDSFRQLVNTYVPYGEQPAKTGDPETALRIIRTKQPDVSDLFISRVTKTPVFNVDLPTLTNGEVTHILNLGHTAESLLRIAQSEGLGPEWNATILDRKGKVLASSRNHAQLVGTAPATFAADLTTNRMLLKTKSPDGAAVLRAVVRSDLTGWRITASIPYALAQAPLRRSLLLWIAITLFALALTAMLAWLLARIIAQPLTKTAALANDLGRDQPLKPFSSSVTEANAIVEALVNASTELNQRRDHQQLLLNELSHRVKNLISVVQAVVMRTLTDKATIREGRDLVMDRLQALGRAHDLLVQADWKGASIREILKVELAPFGARVELDGPDLIVQGRMVQALSLMVHELVTNAIKHGSLSNETGTVRLFWSVMGTDKDARFELRWEERNGPPVAPPTRKGFGTALLAGAGTFDLTSKSELKFEVHGFIYELSAPLSTMVQAAA
jgi:two-component sensor histidine kinase